MAQHSFLIAGGGLAGANAAQTLREEGFTGRIQIVGAEREHPYERPPLSKGYLNGTVERDTIYVHGPGWYQEHDVELLLGSPAVDLDPAGQKLTLSTGAILGYDKLLLATGSSARRLPGTHLQGLYYLRAAQDADALRAALTAGGRRVVVVGAGWIGMETAAAARGYGNQVTVVDPQPTPLRAALGDELGQMFADLHTEHGVDLRLRTQVHKFASAGDRVTGVVTEIGETLSADIVVVGVGARPNVGLAESAGLAIDNGIVADEAMRTLDPDIYAAGDVANTYHPLLGRHLRVEHWANALHGGPAAARSMLGQHVVYDPVPYFYTDQYDLGMEYSGHVEPGGYDQLVYRGDRLGRQFIAFWLEAGRVVAGMNVNVWDVTPAIERLIRSGKHVAVEQLTDQDIPLDELVPEGLPVR
jgi:3-phenylpropionate/trans-cinnamate dioxygenase ferredoxin reductase component